MSGALLLSVVLTIFLKTGAREPSPTAPLHSLDLKVRT
jgi:hypothetical protein